MTIPDDLSIVGFDDITMAAVTIPALTTVRMPIAAIIAKGVELCIGEDAWTGDGVPPQEVMLPELVVRSSTAAAPVGSPAG